MAIILHIETSTSVCSVAVSQNSHLLSLRETTETNSHSEKITVFIEEVIKDSVGDMRLIDAVAVSKGPGSYTGLRIGVSAAKGICYALGKPLIAVNTLLSMANGISGIISAKESSFLLCPMIDARRMEVYFALYHKNLEIYSDVEAAVMTPDFFNPVISSHKIVLFGDGAAKCADLFKNNSQIEIIDNYSISASSMLSLAQKFYSDKKFEDTAYFEPFYLKNFVAGKPKVKGLFK